MNAKNYVVLEHKINDHVYFFHMPVGTSYGQAYDAAHAFLEDILEYSKKAADAAKRDVEKEKAE